MSSVMVDGFASAASALVKAARKDEDECRASWPAAATPDSIRANLGGAVLEMNKTDGSGVVFGFIFSNTTADGVAEDGTVGVYPPQAKAAVGGPDGSKASFEGMVNR